MRQLLSFWMAVAMLCAAIAAAQQAQKQTPAKKTTTTAKKKTTASSKKSAAKRPATTWRNRQLAPSADRYREIQNALVSRGYLSPENATGVWNQTSIDALKRFQTEQNIESTGKINSLSLIALGLGPKREVSAVPAPLAPGQ